jgi:N-acetylglucosaminyldiphosphoundecaprenol N-acetyl-beta-D-mannosaminyltransferase
MLLDPHGSRYPRAMRGKSVGRAASRRDPESCTSSELSQLRVSDTNATGTSEKRTKGSMRWQRVRFLNAWIDSLSMNQLLDLLDEGVVFTINPEHLYHLQRNPEFADAYREATYVSCDSRYVFLALKLIGRGIEHRASGSDLVPAYWRRHANNADVTIFLLGAGPGVANAARDRINRLAGREIVVDAHGPSFEFLENGDESDQVIDMINRSGATCLIVGLGAPKQELWIYRHRARLPNVKVFMGVGATIDYEAEAAKRAPIWMRNTGLEWVYRVLTEPGRYARRYARNTEFLRLGLLDWLGAYKAPGNG